MALHLSGLIGLLALIGLIIGVHVTISLNRGSLNLQPKHVFIYVLYWKVHLYIHVHLFALWSSLKCLLMEGSIFGDRDLFSLFITFRDRQFNQARLMGS